MSVNSGGPLGDMGQPPGLPPERGGGQNHHSSTSAALNDGSDQLLVTHIGLGGKTGDPKAMRSFAQLMADERTGTSLR